MAKYFFGLILFWIKPSQYSNDRMESGLLSQVYLKFLDFSEGYL